MQTKLSSLVESLLNIGSGFFIALAMQQFIVTPLFHTKTNFVENIWITLIFTVVSVVRSYLWRRLFNHYSTLQIKNNNKEIYEAPLDRAHGQSPQR